MQRVRAVMLAVVLLVAAGLSLAPSAPPAAAEPTHSAKGTLGLGYWLVATDGGIFTFGNGTAGAPEFHGSTGALALNKPIVTMVATPTGEGYWLFASDGGVFTFGDAEFFGSTGGMTLNAPIVGAAVTPSGRGYFLVASDGGIFTFGDAVFRGSQGGSRLNRPIVAMALTPTGGGYYLVASDGGIFTFGDARFAGSTGDMALNRPIVGMALSSTATGYYLVASDGGIFAFGAPFRGSQGGSPLNQPIVGMAITRTGLGYYLVAADGGIFAFGDAVFYGSTGGMKLNKPIVGMAVAPNSPVTAPDFAVFLTGREEAPAVGDTDENAGGFALFDFTNDELCYALFVGGIDAPTAAHIHEAPAGVAGPVRIPLAAPDATTGIAEGCIAVDPALVESIFAHPQRFYVNVHNAPFPGGALRSQLFDEFVVLVDSAGRITVFALTLPEAPLIEQVPISGLGAGEAVVGIDVRPSTGDPYVLTVDAALKGRVYRVVDFNETAAPAVRVGGVAQEIAFDASDTGFGLDFDPVTELIRVVSSGEDNLTVHPDSGVVTPQAPLNPPGSVTAAAYSNNNEDADSTTLFVVDSVSDSLGSLASPPSGTVTPVGPLGVDVDVMNGFDIAWSPVGRAGTAALVAAGPGGGDGPHAYAVNPATGQATDLGIVSFEAGGSPTVAGVTMI